MELNHLRYFYEVAKHGSFTGASKALRVSQPSVSKMVRQLERNEGYDFFERAKSGVRLTPMGQILFEGCARVFEEFGTLRQNLDNRKNECAGELWLGASDNLCNYIFPEKMHSFLKRYPLVEVKLYSGVSDDIARRIREYQLEIGFFYTPIKGSDLEAVAVGFADFLIVVGAEHASSAASLKELSGIGLGYVGSMVGDYRGPNPAQRMLRTLKLPMGPAIEVNSQETQKRLVMAGQGFTVLPRHMVEAELKEGKLKQVKVPSKMGSTIYLVKRRKRVLSKVAEIWVKHLKQALSP